MPGSRDIKNSVEAKRSHSPNESEKQARTYTTKHGTEATMNTEQIGRSRGHGARTKAERDERWARAKELAENGHSSHQIAKDLGVGVEGLRVRLREKGIDVPADRVVGKAKLHDSNRILEHMAMDAENFEPYLQKLKNANVLTKDNADLLAKLTGQGEVDWKKMEEVAKKYGIALEGLGPQFQSAKLHEGAQQLWDDYRLLIDSGADVGAVLDGMSGRAQRAAARRGPRHPADGRSGPQPPRGRRRRHPDDRGAQPRRPSECRSGRTHGPHLGGARGARA